MDHPQQAPPPQFPPSKQPNWKPFVIIGGGAFLLFAVCALGIVAGAIRMMLTDSGPGQGEAMIPFTGTTVSGEVINSDDFEGQVMVINFWATWCGPCVQKLPDVIALQEEFADRGVAVVGISGDTNAAALRRFEEERGLNFPTIFEGAHSILQAYEVTGLPTAVVVDRLGNITHRSHFGDLRREVMAVLD